LNVELGDPPVVLAGRVGGDECDLLRVGGEVELIHVKLGVRGQKHALAGYCVDGVDALDFDAVFADYARPGLHGV